MEDMAPDALWRYYRSGYQCLMRNGKYFRNVVRPVFSQVFFLKTVPLLTEYARANHGIAELPPGFMEQMQACPITPRDLLHLDYAICLGYAEAHVGKSNSQYPPLGWPGPSGLASIVLPAEAMDALLVEPPMPGMDTILDDEGDGDDDGPPYDL